AWRCGTRDAALRRALAGVADELRHPQPVDAHDLVLDDAGRARDQVGEARDRLIAERAAAGHLEQTGAERRKADGRGREVVAAAAAGDGGGVEALDRIVAQAVGATAGFADRCDALRVGLGDRERGLLRGAPAGRVRVGTAGV